MATAGAGESSNARCTISRLRLLLTFSAKGGELRETDGSRPAEQQHQRRLKLLPREEAIASLCVSARDGEKESARIR